MLKSPLSRQSNQKAMSEKPTSLHTQISRRAPPGRPRAPLRGRESTVFIGVRKKEQGVDFRGYMKILMPMYQTTPTLNAPKSS